MNPVQLHHLPKRLALPVLAALLLTGCFGGTVAQQLARSIFMHGADKATAAAIDEHERKEKLASQHMVLQSKELDAYQLAFLHSGFTVIQPQVEALPQAVEATEPSVQELQANKLVSVEVWSLLIGDEKQKLLEKASLQGSPLIPPREEWPTWHVAIGAADEIKTDNRHASITFLIPPDLGKMHSGARALVELPHNGELSIARYTLN